MGQNQRHGATRAIGWKRPSKSRQADDDQCHDPDSKILDNEVYLIDGSYVCAHQDGSSG